jgi:arylsulfatase A
MYSRFARCNASFVCTLLLLASVAAAAAPPNFVVILTDDQGYGDLGCYGSTTIKTPNIDRMAAEGARFTSFYAAAPICTPTRAALMTGCHAARVGLSTPLHVFDNIGLAPEETTLPEALQTLGYRTALVGKWHLGHSPEHYPTRHGFDEYRGTPLGHMFHRAETEKTKGDTSGLFLEGEATVSFPEHGDLTEGTTAWAVDFIKNNAGAPFFLLVAHSMPHDPLAVSERFAGKSAGGLYGDVIESIDWSTGQIVDTLKTNGLADNTVVIFTSDNGPFKKHGSAGPLRGFKHEPYEGGLRVPAVAWAPGRISAGQQIDDIVTIMDIYPTLVSMAGGAASKKQVVDGRDVSPLLFGQADAFTHDEFFYFVRHGVLAGIRQGDWKLLLRKGKEVELYNLKADLGESKNVAGDYPELVGRLKARMEGFDADLKETARLPKGSYRG